MVIAMSELTKKLSSTFKSLLRYTDLGDQIELTVASWFDLEFAKKFLWLAVVDVDGKEEFPGKFSALFIRGEKGKIYINYPESTPNRGAVKRIQFYFIIGAARGISMALFKK